MKPKVKKIVLLVPVIIGIGVCIWGFVLRAEVTHVQNSPRSRTQNQGSPNVLTISKGSWTFIDTMGLRCEEVSITPPVRRMIMVNDDPTRIYHLPPGIDNTIYLGHGVTSWKVMIEPDENVSSAKLEYKLVR